MLANPPPIGRGDRPFQRHTRALDRFVELFGNVFVVFFVRLGAGLKVSHSNLTPVASRMRTVAWVTSGPMPSPGMRVILMSHELRPFVSGCELRIECFTAFLSRRSWAQ